MYVSSEQGTAGTPSMPLAGRTVAVTRATHQSESLSVRLSMLGAKVVECPAIAIAPLKDYSHLDAAIWNLGSYDWVIFTSANGVRAFVSRLKDSGLPPAILRSKRLGAIGPATATALEEAGCPPEFVPRTYVAEAVVEQISGIQGARVLLPRADIARKALAEGLRLKGAEVDEVVAYHTVPGEGSGRLAELLREGKVDAVTFTSSSTVRYTVEGLAAGGQDEQEAIDLLQRAFIVCIGPITEGTAREYGLRVAKVAPEYTSDGLVSALVELFDPGAGVGGQDAGNK
jgi:uroporphyrinogen III methyltransferase/synthase